MADIWSVTSDQSNACVDVQIINKQEPRKVEMLSEEEKMEKQVEFVGIYLTVWSGIIFT